MTLLSLQVFEVAPSLYMVEVRKAVGDTLEYHKVNMRPVNSLVYGLKSVFE